MSLLKLRKRIRNIARRDRAKANAWFFKSGKGEYGESDKFLGLTMPEQREIVKTFKGLSLADIKKLLDSKFHEERMIGLLFLVQIYETGDSKVKKGIFDYYIKNKKAINNWDLVDVTTPRIVGNYLKDKNKKLLYSFARRGNLWERRIAILATFAFIREGNLDDSLKISKILLSDSEDLIHKANGWMLREVGKRDMNRLEKFLIENIKKMPRTTLRYAIERFPEKKRKEYLNKK